MKKFYLFGLLSVIILFIYGFEFLKKGETSPLPISKRGYILDRNGEPLVISMEFYKAYYVLKDKKFFNKIPPEVQKYLPHTINLPKKGLVLLSENLSFDEIEELKDVKDVVIQKYYKRKVLYPFLTPYLGKAFDNVGIFGIEKNYDEILKKGESIRLSLDMELEKRLYLLTKDLKIPYQIMVIHLPTGEIKGFISNFPFKFYPKDRLLNIAESIYSKLCKGKGFISPLYQKEEVCEPDFSLILHNPGWYEFGERIYWIKVKNKHLYILSIKKEGEPELIKELGNSLLAKL